MDERKRIALGMSGGVDSSTSATILQRDGYEVIGVTCLFNAGAAADGAIRDAAAVCEQLGIRHVVRDCTADFACQVVEPFVDGYARGFTPIPCVHCNATCKMPALLAAADDLDCTKVATGHYARIARLQDSGRYVVKRALDFGKDQSYMLALLTQEQLARFVTPLGGTTKTAVRIEAHDLNLSVADRPESQDVCFIEGDYREFLAAHGVNPQPGAIVDGAGRRLGTHTGLFNYTIGQRKGIGIAADEPYYVIAKRPEENELVVGFQDETTIEGVLVEQANWQAFEHLDAPLECSVKLRYRATAAPCIVEPTEKGARVHLISPQPTTAPGQCAVFSLGDTVLGGATIVKTVSSVKGDDRR